MAETASLRQPRSRYAGEPSKAMKIKFTGEDLQLFCLVLALCITACRRLRSLRTRSPTRLRPAVGAR